MEHAHISGVVPSASPTFASALNSSSISRASACWAAAAYMSGTRLRAPSIWTFRSAFLEMAHDSITSHHPASAATFRQSPISFVSRSCRMLFCQLHACMPHADCYGNARRQGISNTFLPPLARAWEAFCLWDHQHHLITTITTTKNPHDVTTLFFADST